MKFEAADGIEVEGKLATVEEIDRIARNGGKGLVYLMNVKDGKGNSYMWMADDDAAEHYLIEI